MTAAEPPHATRPFDLRALPPGDAYTLLTHAIAPRPIAWVSTLSAAGEPNLAPYSYFNAGGQNPPSVVFVPNTSPDGEKDTLRNIRETGEYVVNVASRTQAAAMNATAAGLPHGESEWDAAGLTPVPSELVKPGRVPGCPFALECRLHEIVPHGEGPGAANYVIGEVVFAHVAADLLNAAGELSFAGQRRRRRAGPAGRRLVRGRPGRRAVPIGPAGVEVAASVADLRTYDARQRHRRGPPPVGDDQRLMKWSGLHRAHDADGVGTGTVPPHHNGVTVARHGLDRTAGGEMKLDGGTGPYLAEELRGWFKVEPRCRMDGKSERCQFPRQIGAAFSGSTI